MSGKVLEARRLFESMDKYERQQALFTIADLVGEEFAGIKSTPGVCGGDPCIGNHRIPVWSMWNARRLGLSDDEILESYPTLTREDLENAFRYARAHLEETERLIAENEYDDPEA